MRHRDEWHAPSQGLLEWAARLGVDVPVGISALELRGLLTTRGNRQKAAKVAETTQKIRNQIEERKLEPPIRFVRKHDGATYILREIVPEMNMIKAFNEKARRVVQINIANFLDHYKLIE